MTSIQSNLDVTTNKANALGNAFTKALGKPLEVDIQSNLDVTTNKANALGNAFTKALGKPLEVDIQSNLDVTMEKTKALGNAFTNTFGKPLEVDIHSNLDVTTNKTNELGNAFTNTFGKPLEVGIQSNLDVTMEKTKAFENAIKKTEGSAASLQKEIDNSTKKSEELADSLKNNVKRIENNIISLQTEIGVSTEKAKELTNAFLTKRITENIEQSTKAVAMFQRATNAETDSIMSMYNEMYHGASISIKNIDNILANMSKVQHTIGLSEEGMNAAIKSAGKLTTQLRGFGATDEQIKSSTVSLTKFISSMEKVGVSAQVATSFVEQLMDP